MCNAVAKFVLVVFNLIFLLAGLLMLAFGIVAIVKPDYILVILGNIPGMDKIPAAFDLGGIITGSAIFMIVLGGVVGAVGFFGCCGACCESKGLLTGYIVVLVLVLCAEVALIIFAALAPDMLKDTIQKAMKKSMKGFNEDITLFDNNTLKVPDGAVSLGWTFLQIGANCCGTYNYTDFIDWHHNVTYKGMTHVADYPISCCAKNQSLDLDKSNSFDSSTFTNLPFCLDGNLVYINQKNCYDSIFDIILQSRAIAIGIAAGIIGVELFLIILAAVVCRQKGKGE